MADPLPDYNIITGLKRRKPLSALQRKKRATLGSTVSGRMYASKAVEAFEIYMLGAEFSLTAFAVMASNQQVPRSLLQFTFAGAMMFASCSIEMLKLDSLLMDVPDEALESAGYRKQLQNITLDTYDNDDQCREFTRFTKDQLIEIIAALDLEEHVKVWYWSGGKNKYYKFRTETLLIYVCRKLSTAATHKHLADTEFGGDSGRWGRGYNWMIAFLDRRYAPLIGPAGLRAWAPHFPAFAECIRDFLMRDKERIDRDGNVVIQNMEQGNYIAEGEFNVFSCTDCTVYEICRPGSGPLNNREGAPRRPDWYIKQCAFYDGYHRGNKH